MRLLTEKKKFCEKIKHSQTDSGNNRESTRKVEGSAVEVAMIQMHQKSEIEKLFESVSQIGLF